MFRMKAVARVLCRQGILLVAAVMLAGSGYGQTEHADAALGLHVGQSRMIRLDEPVGSVFVAEPATADVQVVSSRVLFVFG